MCWVEFFHSLVARKICYLGQKNFKLFENFVIISNIESLNYREHIFALSRYMVVQTLQRIKMKKNDIQFSDEIYKYILNVSMRENKVLKALRAETSKDPNAIMQIPPEQGQFMGFLIKLIGAKKCLEIGTYTGYSALSMALAIPDDGKVITCDINTQWSDMGLRYWKEAKVNHKIDLKIAPAIETLNMLLENNEDETFDFVFIDADKSNYINYYEKSLLLLKQNGIIAIDNVLLFGSVVDKNLLDDDMKGRISDKDIAIMRELNEKIGKDKRVDISMLPIADGLTLVRKI